MLAIGSSFRAGDRRPLGGDHPLRQRLLLVLLLLLQLLLLLLLLLPLLLLLLLLLSLPLLLFYDYYCDYYNSAVLAIGSDTLDNGAWVQGRSSKIVFRLATIHC